MNHIFIFIIKLYQKFLSPILPRACRYSPSCSQYALEAFGSLGFFCALYLSVKRILKCNPLFEGGLDPVPASCGHNHANNHKTDGIHGRKKF